MLATMMRTPEMSLSPEEARNLAVSAANVAKHYPNTGIDAKTMAWMQLAMVAMGVYGTRAMAITNNRRSRKQSRAVSPENVIPINPGLSGSFPS